MIDGQWVNADNVPAVIAVTDPATGEHLADM
jgi:hypothetical protein